MGIARSQWNPMVDAPASADDWMFCPARSLDYMDIKKQAARRKRAKLAAMAAAEDDEL